MNLKKITIELDIPAVQEVLSIDLDENPMRALAFVKEQLARQVKKCLQPH
ncbi:MAG: hypothetical protein ACP5IL_15935 [Syntrophobacteraceae bacterium]